MRDVSEDILRKASDGDLKSFKTVYTATADFVYNVAFRIVNNREDAQEVTQEVFLNIYRKLKSFRFEASFKTWVYRVTTNYAINFARKTAKSRNRMTACEDRLVSGTVLSDIQEKIDKEQNNKIIETLLNTLNPEQRACVVLRNIEGLSYQEIAQTLKININTVRSRLKRAREKLLAAGKQVDYG